MGSNRSVQSTRNFLLVSCYVVFVIALVAIVIVPFNFLPDLSLRFKSYSLPVHHTLYFGSGCLLLIASHYEILHRGKFPVFFVLSYLFLAALFASSNFTIADKKEAFQTTVGVLFRGMSFGFFAYMIIRYREKDGLVFNALAWAGAVAAFLSLLEIATGHFVFIPRNQMNLWEGDFYHPSSHVAAGAIGQPLPLSVLMNLLFPFSLYLFINKKKWFTLIATSVIAVTIFMTFRRSGYILMFLSIIYIGGMMKQRKVLFALLSVLLMLFYVSMTFIPAFRVHIMTRFSPQAIRSEFIESHRVKVYSTARKMFQSSPWYGVGTRQYPKFYAKFSSYSPAPDTPDNQYLRFLAEGGVIVLGSFLILLLYLLLCLFLGRKSPKIRVCFMAAFVFSLALIVIDGFYWPAIQMVFWIIAGTGIGLADRDAKTLPL